MHVAHRGCLIAVHSPRNPLREADAAVSAALDGPPSPAGFGGAGRGTLLVVIGLGAGYILDVLDTRGWNGRVLAIEPEPSLVPHLRARRDLAPWLDADRLRILTAPDYAGADDCWRWFDESGEAPPLIVNPAIARIRPEATYGARTLVERLQFNAKANANARRQFGARYLLNTLRNLPALASEGDVATLSGAAAGVPAIVVAAGPSLDGNLEGLRAVRDRAVIIAVDTALRPLLAAGIAPHLVIGVDPGESNVRHLSDLPPCPDTYLVAEASLGPPAVEPFRGRTFLFSVSNHEPWPWLCAHGAGRGGLRAWGSVLTSAFDLALTMGCDPIVFAGADLGFTGHRPYCRGIAFEEDWRRLFEWGVPYEEQWKQQVDGWPPTEEPGIDGSPVRTAPHLVAFRNWLVEQMRREPRRRFVNVTGAGILHGGGIEQWPATRLAAELPAPKTAPRDLVARAYQPRENSALLDAATRLQADGEPIETWTRFADGLTPERILNAMSEVRGRKPEAGAVPGSVRAEGHFDFEWIAPLAASLPLVPMEIQPQRMQKYASGVRLFRFRTTAARLIGCVLRLPDAVVLEDRRPLRRRDVSELESIQPGEYVLWRDEVYITASDGSDPRENGRTYSLLVPETIVFLESLPLHEVLQRHV